ncbi:MAG: M24 family metallopeptidase, partial [Alphaproteobacteria bacterium]
APENQMATYEVTLAAQQAALDAIKPGAIAEDVAEAANAVYREAGFAAGYRTGRAIGMSYLEAPELKQGDRTVLQEGMTFAVDGGITVSPVEARAAIEAVAGVEGVDGIEAMEATDDQPAVEAVEAVAAVAAIEAQAAVEAQAGYGARVGDSIVVTADGFEFLTPFEKRDQVRG